MKEIQAIGFIGSLCVRMFGLMLVMADFIIPAHCVEHREFVDKQRKWFSEQQDMLEVEAMVNEALGSDAEC